MKNVRICDETIVEAVSGGNGVTFRQKLEIAKILDEVGVDVISLGEMAPSRADDLLVKTVAGEVRSGEVSVACPLDENAIARAAQALKGAAKGRIDVTVPLSTAMLEYVTHKKPDGVCGAIRSAVAYAKEQGLAVSFTADDATRTDPELLERAVEAAVGAGAETVTVCDRAGAMLPDEFARFAERVKAMLPDGVKLGAGVSNGLDLADACAAAAVRAGADEVRVSMQGKENPSLVSLAKILEAKGAVMGAACRIRMTQLLRAEKQAAGCLKSGNEQATPFEDGVRAYADDVAFDARDGMDDVMRGVEKLGYELSETDKMRVWNAFSRIASKKGSVGLKELDVIVASESMQVAPAYSLESYVVTTGNAIDICAHVKLRRGNELLNGLSLGDGPIDAAFLAIEKITGCHYELDDFQIQAITEGREAMGQTLVRLRSNGKLYAGRGLSTDIIGSGIEAYINALNKIVFEEENA